MPENGFQAAFVDDDAGEHLRLREQAREAGSIAKWDQDILGSLMSTPQGRHWMERLLDACSMFGELYYGDGDALGMAKRDGKAAIGRYLINQIELYTPNEYMRMVRERRARIEIQRRKADEQRRKDMGAAPAAHTGLTDIERMAEAQALRQEMLRREEASPE